MHLYKFVLFLTVSSLFFSCKTPVDVVYFQDSKNLEKIVSKNSFTPVFKVDDILSILVSATDMEAARPFNFMQSSGVTAVEGTGVNTSGVGGTNPTYLIDEEGNIDFPVLGKLKIAGLTRVQTEEMIKEKLLIYIKDPTINVRLKNFKITVIGEVNRPGSYSIPNERITIIEALGLAGDITITGKRNNIVVIRESEGANTYHRVDLTSKSIFDSQVYYLAQNDVLYIEPNKAKIKTSKGRDNITPVVLGILGVTLAALNLFIN